jgi:hypothetical protein
LTGISLIPKVNYGQAAEFFSKFNYSKEVIGRYPPPNAVMSNHFLSCFFSRAQALNQAIAVIAQPDSTDATTRWS